MSGSHILAIGFVAVLLIGVLVYGVGIFPSDCIAHGGAHVTYPYKAMPECWDAEGRRVFW